MTMETKEVNPSTDINITPYDFLSIDGYEIKLSSISAFSNIMEYNHKTEEGKKIYSFKIIFDSLVYEIFNDDYKTCQNMKNEIRKLYRIWFNNIRKK